MITAVDTNVLLDVFSGDADFGPRSRAALERCLDEGSLVVCEVVWAETSAAFPEISAATAALDRLAAVFSPTTATTAAAAGVAWREYRRAGGRARVVSDFLVGAHAATQADRLLTRDRGFYRRYFTALRVLDPMT